MNKIPIFSLTLLFALILPLFANAQVTVKGIVTDESGVPLVGVSVRYKEVPQVGVTTDIDGKFSIKEVKEGKTLVFSYIGMKNAERLLKGTTSFIKIQIYFDYFIFKGTTGINLDNCNILLYTVYQKEAKK